MDPRLLTYYEAIEQASADMLIAARAGNWDEVVKLEGACVLLISQLKHAAQAPVQVPVQAPTQASTQAPTQTPRNGPVLEPAVLDAARAKSRIMQRILVNDAEIRHLAEPWLQDLDDTLAGRRKTLH